jgi:hypothetical protein
MPEQLLPSTPQATTPSPHQACRVYERHACVVASSCKPTSAWRDSETSWSASIRDISLGGVRLTLRRRFEPGAGLEIALSTDVPAETYSVLARVVHVHREDDGSWTLGCKFLSELSEEEVRHLVPPPELAAGPVTPSSLAATHLPAEAFQQGPRQTLSGVHIRLESATGTVLDCPIRNFNVPATWPPPAGKELTFVALTADRILPATRVAVIDCTPQGEGWLLRCRLLDPPRATPAAPAAPAP